MARGVGSGDDQRGCGDFAGRDLREGQFVRQRYGDRARTCAYVDDAWRGSRAGLSQLAGQLDRLLHEEFGLRPRNEHIAIYVKGQAVELGFAGDVLDGLASKAAFDGIAKRGGLIRRERVGVVREEPREIGLRRVLPERVEEQRLSIAARARGMRALGEELRGCVESEAEGRTSVRCGLHARSKRIL